MESGTLDHDDRPPEQVTYEARNEEYRRLFKKTGNLKHLLDIDDSQELNCMTSEWLYSDFATHFVTIVDAFKHIKLLREDSDSDYWRVVAAALKREFAFNDEKAARIFADSLVAQCAVHQTRLLTARIFVHALERFKNNGICGICESESEDSLYHFIESDK